MKYILFIFLIVFTVSCGMVPKSDMTCGDMLMADNPNLEEIVKLFNLEQMTIAESNTKKVGYSRWSTSGKIWVVRCPNDTRSFDFIYPKPDEKPKLSGIRDDNSVFNTWQERHEKLSKAEIQSRYLTIATSFGISYILDAAQNLAFNNYGCMDKNEYVPFNPSNITKISVKDENLYRKMEVIYNGKEFNFSMELCNHDGYCPDEEIANACGKIIVSDYKQLPSKCDIWIKVSECAWYRCNNQGCDWTPALD